MTRLEFDFNDAIYQHTGINLNSPAMLENDIAAINGEMCFVQIWKRNLDMKETLFITLRDAAGCPVEDVCLSVNNRILKLDAGSSGEAVSVELEAGVKHFEMALESESHGVKTEIVVLLEQHREESTPDGLKKEMADVEAYSRRLTR